MNLWIDVRGVPAKRRLPLLKEAHKVGARVVLTPEDPPREDALVLDGDTFLDGPDPVAKWLHVAGPEDQARAAAEQGTVVVSCDDWKVIPLENLIAARRDRPGGLFARAASVDEARLFLGVLETGVDGIFLAAGTAADIAAAADMMRGHRPPQPDAVQRADRSSPGTRGRTQADAGPAQRAPADGAGPPLVLAEADVVSVEDAGSGDRVCVDATRAFAPDEGLLVGSTSRSMCLVLAETESTGWVRPRPFRVNAGALHAYVGGGVETRYLSEAQAGTHLTAVATSGAIRGLTVGRAKIETRPHVLVRWEREGRPGSMVLQWAETVRLATPEGAVAVTSLKPGDVILVHESVEGRHMGMAVDAGVEER